MPELLRLDDVTAGYGDAVILSDVSFAVGAGEAVALLGRNGAGKTTLLCTILGLTRRRDGTVRLDGRDVARMPPERRARAGLGWVPQERGIFRSLTVAENLSAVARPGPWTPERVYDLLPRLAERRRNRGGQLSGGEQQMLAIGRALVTNPRLLLLDEPLEGLAPIIVGELLRVIGRLVRDEGLGVLLVEQHALKVLGITDRALVLERGRMVHDGPSAALAGDSGRLEAWLGVAARA